MAGREPCRQFIRTAGVFVVHDYRALTVTQADALTDSQLKTNAFFDTSVDTALFTTNSSGSTYAQANQTRILADTIPALTLPIGANSVDRLAPSGQPDRNLDMQALYENGWASARPSVSVGASAFGEWHHSDYQVVAYLYTHELFDEIVTLGNLK